MNSEESFAALVNTANPAASHSHSNNPYLQNSYPPTSHAHAQPNLMDPFFDDDDDLLDSTLAAPDSAFAMHSTSRAAPMQSQDSGLPLARSAIPPAGLGASSVSLATTGTGQPQGWNFDDDAAFPGSAQFPGTPSTPKTPSATRRRKWKWKWPWEKEVVMTGERVIALNNSPMNDGFCDNFVSTSKYNMATFVPKFLKGAFVHVHVERG